ncbi:MAG: hypothetical protein A2X84_06750 [Desulfuromonadaceae bacterium GWC2_58_13]|nr:MAG: hypothetical protein A2X84_06750 [Desulfuromonadaceae bacterium GWC2_58_13]
MMKKQWCGIGLLLVTVMLLGGCMSGRMDNVQKTGFLSDYSQLREGGEDRAALVYIKPGVNFKPYNKLMFERVVVMVSNNAEYRAIDPAIYKELTDYYQNALFEAVKDGYEIVDRPGPGVLRVRAAITDVKPSKPVANTLSSITPPGIAASLAVKLATDDNLGTGEAASEFEVLDAMTGERLAAAVDRRQGGKMVFRGKWSDTKEAFDLWAQRFRQRLDEARK